MLSLMPLKEKKGGWKRKRDFIIVGVGEGRKTISVRFPTKGAQVTVSYFIDLERKKGGIEFGCWTRKTKK